MPKIVPSLFGGYSYSPKRLKRSFSPTWLDISLNDTVFARCPPSEKTISASGRFPPPLLVSPRRRMRTYIISPCRQESGTTGRKYERDKRAR